MITIARLYWIAEEHNQSPPLENKQQTKIHSSIVLSTVSVFGNITVIKNTLQLTYLEITTNTSSTEAAMSMFLKRRTEKTLNKAQ